MLAGREGGCWKTKWLLMSYLSAFNTAVCGSHFEKSLEDHILDTKWPKWRSPTLTRPNMDILDKFRVMEICKLILFFYCISLLKFPREPPEQSVWSQHMLLLLLEPPGWLSWENTESGSGSLWTDLSLWTPKGPQGPSGCRQITQTVVQSLKLEHRLAPTDMTGGLVVYLSLMKILGHQIYCFLCLFITWSSRSIRSWQIYRILAALVDI